MTDSESARLAELVRQAWRGEPGGEDAWHGSSLRKIGVRRLGGEVIDATTGSAEDWPAVEEATEEAWRGARDRLARAQTSLAEALESSDDARLADRATGCSWTNHRMVHGTLHHDVYHAGQIALLRRASSG